MHACPGRFVFCFSTFCLILYPGRIPASPDKTQRGIGCIQRFAKPPLFLHTSRVPILLEWIARPRKKKLAIDSCFHARGLCGLAGSGRAALCHSTVLQKNDIRWLYAKHWPRSNTRHHFISMLHQPMQLAGASINLLKEQAKTMTMIEKRWPVCTYTWMMTSKDRNHKIIKKNETQKHPPHPWSFFLARLPPEAFTMILRPVTLHLLLPHPPLRTIKNCCLHTFWIPSGYTWTPALGITLIYAFLLQ